MKRKRRWTKYPLWQYPIIFVALFRFLARHKFQLNAIIRHRKSIGVNDFRIKAILDFGHWLVSEEFGDIWWHS